MKILKALLIPCLLLLTASAAVAQPQNAKRTAAPTADHHAPAPLPQFFRLTFVVKEFQGAQVIDSRKYTVEISALSLAESRKRYSEPSLPPSTEPSIRAGTKLAVQTGNGNFQYIDLGMNIDCRNIVVVGNRLAMHVTAVLSSIGSPNKPSNFPPLIHQNRWSSGVIIPIGKSSVLFSSQDPASTRTVELDVSATPIH